MAHELEAIQDQAFIQRFWSRVIEQENGCWIYQGYQRPNGYGAMGWNPDGRQRQISVHRLSFVLYHQRGIGEGLQICHHCDVRNCVNPEHLFEGTGSDNMMDASQKGRLKDSKGENSGTSVLTWEWVHWIRAQAKRRRGSNKLSHQQITDGLYQVSGIRVARQTVSRVIRNQIWVE